MLRRVQLPPNSTSLRNRPRGILSFGRKSDRRIEETIDTLYKCYSSELHDVESPISMSPEQAQQVQVQKFLIPSGGFGLTVQPSFEAVTDDLRVSWEGSSIGVRDMSSDMSSLTTTLILELYNSCKGSHKLMLSELQGQYAFVLYDGARKDSFAARDPSGAENLFYKDQDDGSVALTNSLDHLPPGHFMTGKDAQLQQFALTPEQLILRERRESLEHGLFDDLSLGSPPGMATSPPTKGKSLFRLSRKSRSSIPVN
eukprot:gene18622-25137_t